MKLSDNEILDGWRRCDSSITRDYFYPYCHAAWYISDRRYQLASKQDMDFYSLTHEYYIKLAQKQWQPLEHRQAGISLRSYLINGYHFLVLDELKVYRRLKRLESFEDRVANGRLHFDLAEDTAHHDFVEAIHDICGQLSDAKDRAVLLMKLVDGYAGKEISKQLGMSPSAISQRYQKLLSMVVRPYFRGEPVEDPAEVQIFMTQEIAQVPDRSSSEAMPRHFHPCIRSSKVMKRDINRITPDRVTRLEPNEVFVFGSNLAGMHGGGAARQALLKFGAILGKGVGMQGQSYAIPTMQGGVDTIKPYVDDFIDYAVHHPEKRFLVTQIGCGIAGFTPEDIAPLFSDAVKVDNICLPRSFWYVLDER